MTLTVEPAVDRLLLPEHPPRLGPVSRRLLLRLAVVLAVVEAVGLWLVLTGGPAAVAAGTSLVFPGSGFLYVAAPVLFLVSLALLVVALVLWWGASVHLAIPVVWALGAVVPALLADGPRLWVADGATWGWAPVAAGVMAVAFVGTAAFRFERRYRQKLQLVPELNAYLAEADVVAARPEPRLAEPMDVELLRWSHSIAFQPDDELTGLDWGDQFHSGTQLRYQLNALCWGLSLYAANFVPNAVGQMDDTIAKLIERHTDLRVWGYWRTLNLVGNFDADPDPIVRDNIMFSGFLGDVINVYEAATGNHRFDQPGSLTFVWKDGRTFAYDHHTIAEAVQRNFERSRLGFFPCEPGWSFTVCNMMGAQTLYGHDTLHGTDGWERVKPRWLAALDGEYLTPDGSYAHIRSNHVGLSWDTGEVPGGHYLAAGSNRFADLLPDHAWRASALEQKTGLHKIRGLAAMVRDGRLDLELPEQLERHRARTTALNGWNSLIGGAGKFGEFELQRAARDASARQCATGLRWPERPLKGSVNAIGSHMIVRFTGPLSTADLNIRGHVPPAGPVLDTHGWTDVLITEARSADARSLVVRGERFEGDDPIEVELTFSSLQPGVSYHVEGVDAPGFVADAEGRATVTALVSASFSLTLSPEVDA